MPPPYLSLKECSYKFKYITYDERTDKVCYEVASLWKSCILYIIQYEKIRIKKKITDIRLIKGVIRYQETYRGERDIQRFRQQDRKVDRKSRGMGAEIKHPFLTSYITDSLLNTQLWTCIQLFTYNLCFKGYGNER